MSASRWREDRGLTLPIVALMIGTLVLMVSFAVDLGRQRADRRLAQAGADVVALDMMRVVNGRTLQAVAVDDLTATIAALNESATNNGFTNEVGTGGSPDPQLPRITGLEWGTVTALGNGDTFVALLPIVGRDIDGDLTPDLQEVPNAVRIKAERSTDYFFQPGEGSVTRFAVAALPQPVVDLTVGSVGAGFRPGYPVASATLSATVEVLNRRFHRQFNATTPNPSTGFDLVGYQGLAAADVDLWRVAADAGFASPNEMLESDMSVGQFFDATASALDQQAAEGDPNAANAAAELRRFETQMGVGSTGTMRLGDTIDYEQGGDDAAATGSINVLDLLSGGANVIDGANFVSYEFTSGIPFPTGGEFVSAEVTQYLVSPPTFKPGLGVGGLAENSQIRFQVNITVAPLTGMAGPSTTCAASPFSCVTIPLVIEAANATGEVDRLDCADPLASSEAEIGVTTSGVSVRLGTATDLQAETMVVTPGVLVQSAAELGLPVLDADVFLALGLSPLQILGLDLNAALTGTASASVLGGSSQHVFFPYQPPVDFQRAPGGVGAATLGSQLSSTLSVSLGSSVLSSTAMNALRSQLSYVFTDLQDLIIDPILQQAGVNVAGADVKADNMRCEGHGLRLVG